jgi:hypothetical protein
MGMRAVNIEYHSPPPEAEAWVEAIEAMIDRNQHRNPHRAGVWRSLFREALRVDVLDLVEASCRIGVTPGEIADTLIAMRDCGLLEYEATPGTSCILVSVCMPGRNPRAAM